MSYASAAAAASVIGLPSLLNLKNASISSNHNNSVIPPSLHLRICASLLGCVYI